MAEKPCVIDRIPYRVWPAIAQRTVRKRIADQVDAAFVFAGTNFVNVHRRVYVEVSKLLPLGCIGKSWRTSRRIVGKLLSRPNGSAIFRPNGLAVIFRETRFGIYPRAAK